MNKYLHYGIILKMGYVCTYVYIHVFMFVCIISKD